MKNLLKQLFAKYDIVLTPNQLDQYDKYYNLVIEENKKYNLTAITEKNDFASKHILDSVLPSVLLPQNAKVIDIGAGAGFPSIPLKILRPDLNLVMLDSLNKRVNFLNMCISQLGFIGATAVHDRAEDYVKNQREKFDIAIARAVANLSTLAEYCLPYVKVGGAFVALKGSSYKEEIQQAESAINILGGKITNIQNKLVEEIDGERANIVISKIKPTPVKYPRGKNQPRLKPL